MRKIYPLIGLIFTLALANSALYALFGIGSVINDGYKFTPDWYHNNVVIVFCIILFSWLIQPRRNSLELAGFAALFFFPFYLWMANIGLTDWNMVSRMQIAGEIYAWGMTIYTAGYLIYSIWRRANTKPATKSMTTA